MGQVADGCWRGLGLLWTWEVTLSRLQTRLTIKVSPRTFGGKYLLSQFLVYWAWIELCEFS